MATTEMRYRDNEYFNAHDTYVFENSLGQVFESKVERGDDDKGYWYTTHPNRPSYKATSLVCAKV